MDPEYPPRTYVHYTNPLLMYFKECKSLCLTDISLVETSLYGIPYADHSRIAIEGINKTLVFKCQNNPIAYRKYKFMPAYARFIRHDSHFVFELTDQSKQEYGDPYLLLVILNR